MKTYRKILIFLLAGACLVTYGCSGVSIAIKSYSESDIVKMSGRPISGQACGFELFGVIPIRINSRLERAFEALQEQALNSAITNVTIEEYWRYSFAGTKYCTVLEATAYQKK